MDTKTITVPRRAMEDFGLHEAARLLLLKLYADSNEAGLVAIDYEMVARFMGRDARSVRRHLDALRENGYTAPGKVPHPSIHSRSVAVEKLSLTTTGSVRRWASGFVIGSGLVISLGIRVNR